MAYILTAEERQIALRQITALDSFNSAANRRGPTYRIVPIPPRNRGEPERWVAVEPITRTITTDVVQPNPNKDVLWAGTNSYGFVCYYYADKLPYYITCTIIFAVIFSIFTTPLVLLCCIPMASILVKAQHDIEDGDPVSARKKCNSCLCYCVGATIWISVAFVLIVVLAIVVTFAAVGIF